MSKVKWTDALLSTATTDLNYAQPGRGRTHRDCKQSFHMKTEWSRSRTPPLSQAFFCGRFGLPKLKNNVRRSVSHHRRRRSTATIKLTSSGELRRVHAAQGLSGSSHRRQEQEGWCPCHTADDLVVCIDGWTCHEPMRGLLRREVFPTKT